MRPTRRALILAAAGLPLALLPTTVAPELWVIWAGYGALLLAAVAVDAVFCRRARELDIEVTLPEHLYVDDPDGGEAVVRLALPTARAVTADVTLDLAERLEPAEPQRAELSANPVEVRLALRPKRRGPARIETLWVRFDAPLGLFCRTVRHPVDRVLKVSPNVRRVRGNALKFLSVRDARVGLKIEHYVGDGSEFSALREFSAGLDPRSIDWKASARHTRLLSREFRAERNHQIILGIDTGRLMAEPLAGAPLLDHAIHAALLLALVSLRQGDRVGFFPFAGKPGRLQPPRGGMGTLSSLTRLAGELRYSTEETNFTLSLTHLASRLPRRSLVVVFTDFVDSVTAELMVENLGRLGRRHLVVFVALLDPTLAEVADSRPRTLLDVDRSVVAASFQRERQLTLGRLRKAGIFAIDAPPARVGPRLIDRYLEIKRKEMI
ncbi:MAG: DUF58 domain-containing protein [bacterium]|nr:DUF58 domain-containing protein [bacterium]